MAEDEEWTTVVNSKSRPKKELATPATDNGNGATCSGKFEVRNTNHQIKSFYLRNNPSNSKRDSTVQFKVLKKPDDKSNKSSQSQSNISVASTPRSAKFVLPLHTKRDSKGNNGTKPATVKASASTSSVDVLLTKRVPQHFPAVPTIFTSRNAAPNQNANKSIQTKPNGQGNNDIPPNSNSQSTNDSIAPPTAPNKKRKSRNKDERRRKREEKFYQALYQNKDSHIQFVSADMVRQLQGGDQKPSFLKQNCSKTKKALSDASPTTPMTAIPTSSFFQHDFDAFPSLNSRNDIVPKGCVPWTSIPLALNAEPLFGESVLTGSNSESVPETSETKHTDAVAGDAMPKPSSSAKGKKSKAPMTLDLSDLIVSKKKEKDNPSRKRINIASTPRRLGVIKKENYKITAGNPLDSSGPGVIHRGKIKQKKKKPTKLKLSILKSRTLRKLLLEEKNKQEAQAFKEEPNEEIVDNPFSPERLNSHTVEEEDIDKDVSSIVCQLDSFIITESSSPPDIKPELKIERENSSQQVIKVKVEEIIDTNTDDTTLKFIKLLDEMTMLKIAEDKLSPEVEVAVKIVMHNRKFRDYCDMYTSKELHKLVNNLLSELFRFQDRLYHTDPIKFKTKRRFVSGLKEALCYLNLNKVQLLIIAPDIEKNPEPGGLDQKINQILTVAKGKGVPYVFSGTKYNLGKPMKIKTPISIISILDKQNCEDTFRALLEEAGQLREKYHNDFVRKANELGT